MRICKNNPPFSHAERWIRLVMFVITLSKEAVMDEELHALLGGSVSFNLKVTENITVTLAEWSRCPQNKVFVFSPGLGLSVLDKSYEGRLSSETNHTILLEKIQMSDFVNYCYKLSTFPDGSLQGKIKLVQKPPSENGLPTTLILSVGCGSGVVLLIGIAASVICCKRRRGFPVNSLLDKAVCQRNQNKSKSTSTKSDDEEQCDDIGYLEVTLP